jgi:hypothetical protein
VSKVFHSLPQVQNHLSSLRGDQPQSGQRMLGVPRFFSSSRSRYWKDARIVGDRTHARYYDLRPDYLGSVRRFAEALAQHQPYRAATAYSAL